MPRRTWFSLALALVAAALADSGCPDNTWSDGDADSDADSDADADTDADTDADSDTPPGADSDGDLIGDNHEGTGDPDGDGVPNYQDDDSDGDGVLDRDEAGDTDVSTFPVDTDGDTYPDFLDLDSDGDGLTDAEEAARGTSRTAVDTDGDGATDLVEVASGTDPLSDTDNPRVRGDFVFVVPYEEPPAPPQDTLVFGTAIQMADVYFAIDRSASMRAELDNLRASLQGTIVPAVDAVIPGVWFGVGFYDQCPMRGECTSSGTPVWIRNYQNLAEDTALTEAALGEVTDTCNGAHEPYISTMWLVANGDPSVYGWLPERVAPRDCPGCEECPDCPPCPEWIGYPCFRAGAVPILVMFGDEDVYGQSYRSGCEPESGDAPSFEDAMAALNGIGARFIGINSGNSLPGFTDAANGTGSVDTTGAPLAFTIPNDGSGLGDQVVDAIELLAGQVPMDIRAVAVDVDEGPTDLVDAAASFVDRVEPNVEGGVADPADATRICVGGLPVIDADGDGAMDTFDDVVPGTIVCFDVIPLENTTVPAGAEVQMFRAEIQVLGRADSVLDRRDVFFLVPPEIADVGPS